MRLTNFVVFYPQVHGKEEPNDGKGSEKTEPVSAAGASELEPPHAVNTDATIAVDITNDNTRRLYGTWWCFLLYSCLDIGNG